jgi:Family of unknown function (DUF6665)
MLPERDRNPRLDKTPAAALEYELAQEMAAALGRLGRRLERALHALAEFDAANVADIDGRRQKRLPLLAEAGDALWLFVVQREACGLRDGRQLMRDYRVPPEVQYRMGISGSRHRLPEDKKAAEVPEP